MTKGPKAAITIVSITKQQAVIILSVTRTRSIGLRPGRPSVNRSVLKTSGPVHRSIGLQSLGFGPVLVILKSSGK